MPKKHRRSFKEATLLLGGGLSVFAGCTGQPALVIVSILAAAFHEDIDNYFLGKAEKK